MSAEVWEKERGEIEAKKERKKERERAARVLDTKDLPKGCQTLTVGRAKTVRSGMRVGQVCASGNQCQWPKESKQ